MDPIERRTGNVAGAFFCDTRFLSRSFLAALAEPARAETCLARHLAKW